MRYQSMARTLGILVLCGAAGTACQSIREAAGVAKTAPDEFAVVTKAPLVVPPEFSLRPPRPGERPANQVDPTELARTSLYGTSVAERARTLGPGYSDGEKLLLAYSGAVTADPSIRSVLASESAQYESKGDDFAQQVLFWQGPPADPTAKPVDAAAEAERIRNAEAQGRNPADTGQTPIRDEDDSGFLGGIF